MGTASSSIVINLPPTSSPSSQPAVDGASARSDAPSSSSEPVIDHASKPSSSSSSEPAAIGNPSSSPSSLSSGDPLVDGIIKTFFCASFCEDKFKKVDRFCGVKRADDTAPVAPPAASDAGECTKAVAAMRKCLQGKAALYEGYVRDTDDKQQQQEQQDPTDESKIEA